MKAFFNQRHTAKKFGLAALGVAVTMGAGHLNAAPLKEELETLVLTLSMDRLRFAIVISVDIGSR